MNLKKRTMDEMITHFNDVVSEMNIPSKEKMTLLGMVTAIGYEAQNAADAIEELSKPRWIPVTERLPQEREWVLCQCRAKIRMVLRLQNGYWHQDSRHEFMSGFVTHWMPLPEPPKEET